MNQSTVSTVSLPKFTLRASNLEVSAQNAIKRSNVRSFVNKGISSIEGGNLLPQSPNNSSQHLLQLKSSCCGIKKNISNKENEAVRIRDQIKFTAEKLKVVMEQRHDLETKIAKLEQNVEQVNSKKMAANHCHKTYQHILERMKKDQITLQLRKNDLQSSIKVLSKGTKELENQCYTLGEVEYLGLNGLKEAESEVESQKEARKNKLVSLQNALEAKKEAQFKIKERGLQTSMIKEMAAGDLEDAELIRAKKFLSVQIFLKGLLKAKIQRLKEFYEPYETAFLKIKSNTSIKDASSMKQWFNDFETSYNGKAAWVKKLQENISEATQKQKELQQKYRTAKERELVLMEELDKRDLTAGNQSNKSELEKKALVSEVTLMRIKEWLSLQQRRFGLNKNGDTSLQSTFKALCTYLANKQGESFKIDSPMKKAEPIKCEDESSNCQEMESSESTCSDKQCQIVNRRQSIVNAKLQTTESSCALEA